ncbi:MAG: DUF4232 domain-containing protein [Actinomycetes bacterium]
MSEPKFDPDKLRHLLHDAVAGYPDRPNGFERIRVGSRRRRLLHRLALTSLVVVLVGSGIAVAQAQNSHHRALEISTSPTPASTSCSSDAGSRRAPAQPTPSINWDRLMEELIPVPIGAGASTGAVQSAVQQVGALSFAPTVPPFTAPFSVGAQNPKTIPSADRGVEFLYTFRTGGEFAKDGRVAVMETPTTQSDAFLTEMAASWRACGLSNAVSLFTLGSTHGLLMTGSGTARVLVISHGVKFDLMGPALTRSTAGQLARSLYAASQQTTTTESASAMPSVTTGLPACTARQLVGHVIGGTSDRNTFYIVTLTNTGNACALAGYPKSVVGVTAAGRAQTLKPRRLSAGDAAIPLSGRPADLPPHGKAQMLLQFAPNAPDCQKRLPDPAKTAYPTLQIELPGSTDTVTVTFERGGVGSYGDHGVWLPCDDGAETMFYLGLD